MKQLKNIYQNNNGILNDAFDRLVAQIHIKKQKDDLKSFVICGTEPGVGTTTISINLAIAMAQAGWKTLLIDGDLRKASGDKRLNEESDAGLSEFLNSTEALEDVICATNYEHLSYISSGFGYVNVVSAFCSAHMKGLLTYLQDKYDYIIIDMPSLSTAVDAVIMSGSVSGVMLVTSQKNGQRKAIKDAKKQLERTNANVLGIIVNQVEDSEYRRAMKNYDYFKKHKYFTRES